MSEGARSIPARLLTLLQERGVAYEELHHPRDFTAEETAHHTHTPGREFAKAVVVRTTAGYALAVVPSNHRVDLEKMAGVVEGREAELATEEEIRRICQDCDVGAVPPFGHLYGMAVVASPDLAHCDHITCVAGTHEDAIRLSWRDFVRIARPQIADISERFHGGPEPGPASAHA